MIINNTKILDKTYLLNLVLLRNILYLLFVLLLHYCSLLKSMLPYMFIWTPKVHYCYYILLYWLHYCMFSNYSLVNDSPNTSDLSYTTILHFQLVLILLKILFVKWLLIENKWFIIILMNNCSFLKKYKFICNFYSMVS